MMNIKSAGKGVRKYWGKGKKGWKPYHCKAAEWYEKGESWRRRFPGRGEAWSFLFNVTLGGGAIKGKHNKWGWKTGGDQKTSTVF